MIHSNDKYLYYKRQSWRSGELLNILFFIVTLKRHIVITLNSCIYFVEFIPTIQISWLISYTSGVDIALCFIKIQNLVDQPRRFSD